MFLSVYVSKFFPKQLLKKITRFVNTVTRFVNIDTKVTRFVNIGPPAIFLEKDYSIIDLAHTNLFLFHHKPF